VIWAHGYIDVTQPLGFYHLELPDGTSLPGLVQRLGFAFATTSYRQNGLAILEGVDDIRELVVATRQETPKPPVRTYLVGASEGGLVTALAVERLPGLFSGGFAACGPIGDFKKQVDYVGDFRVLFDYFFPRVIPGDAIAIPNEVMHHWDTKYRPAIMRALAADPVASAQLMRTARAPTDPSDPSTIETTTLNLLSYQTFGANDATAKLGGNPYGNRRRWYRGSDDDARLNRLIIRYDADPAALLRIVPYQTAGRPTVPLITMHTTRDEIIPFWHEPLYARKAARIDSDSLVQIPIARYGHCNLTAGEVLGGFGLLVHQVTGARPEGISRQYDPETVRRNFEETVRAIGTGTPNE
jgi:pimeloyl-ACP methyl ester carboxylesterase